ncbi:NUDIX hydrolase [Streptomyces sp. NPDC127069]|uniref:NUDIX hydrolase n=1 Tax=Streptomyces sp. NPDC127069 TaxID=3347128 RepID=UPI00364E6C2E
MDVIDTWTGRMACWLQASLRLGNQAFADHLGVALRTVAGWHAQPDLVPRHDIQSALDTVYEKAPAAVHARFARFATQAETATAQALRVAIAVVVRAGEVLLVQRRDHGGLTWQFPAGVVKPGGDAQVVAVRETLAETGVHCTVRVPLGARQHPATGVQATYWLCDHLMGEASNCDPEENSSVAWVPISSVSRFIPAERIYPPVLTALEAHA